MKSSLARNVASSWAATALGVVSALLITPVVVEALGQEQYGIWSFLNGLMGYANLLYLGVGSALIKYIATSSANHDQAAINRLTSVAVTIFATLGLATLLAFLGVSPFITRFLAEGLEAETARSASMACALLGVQVLCFFLTSGFMATLFGHDRFDLANLAQMGTALARLLFIAPVVAGDRPLVRLAIFMTLTSVVELVIVRTLAYRVNPALRVAVTRPNTRELSILYGFGLPAFLITFSLRLISYTDTTVIGAVLGAASVGLYVLPLQLIEYTRLVVSGYSGVLMSRIVVLYAKGDIAAVRGAYLLTLRIASLLASYVLANLLWLGVPFLELWVGPGYGEPARWVLVWLALATFLQVFSTLAALPFYNSLHILKTPAKVLVFEALLNLVLSIPMARRFGISGVALATLIPACLSFALLPRLLTRPLAVSTASWIRAAMVPGLALAVVVSASHWLLSLWIDTSTFVSLTLRAAGTMPGAAAVALAMTNAEERASLVARLGRIARPATSNGTSAAN